jgi:DNA-binding response OmpR family regulator
MPKREHMHDLTLLYAEDDDLIRENLLYILKDYFNTIHVSKDGEEVMDLYHSKNPDIVILDICMPKTNGLEAAKLIRHENETIPIIMLTGHSDRERLLDAVNLKLEAYLVKPIDYTQLDNILKKTIERLKEDDIIPLRKELTWDAQTQILRYKSDVIKLTKKEKLTLAVLAQNTDHYLPNDALIYHIWHDEIPDESHDNKLIQLIYRLNRKIDEQTDYRDKLIENSYTLGYRILYKDI